MVEANRTRENVGKFTIVIDDISLLEVAAHGSVNDVLDFLHYCATLTSEMVNDQTWPIPLLTFAFGYMPFRHYFSWQNCSLVILIHEDIYSCEENMGLLVHLRYIADLVVKAAPLNTGLAADVHGQVRHLLSREGAMD